MNALVPAFEPAKARERAEAALDVHYHSAAAAAAGDPCWGECEQGLVARDLLAALDEIDRLRDVIQTLNEEQHEMEQTMALRSPVEENA